MSDKQAATHLQASETSNDATNEERLSGCCVASELASCCAPSDKPGCCGAPVVDDAPSRCGCR